MKKVLKLVKLEKPITLGVKAVHHKYLIRALVGGASVRDDIVIATPSSTPDNIKLTSSKSHALPRMLKFSVGKGIRIAYEPMLDDKGKIIEINGILRMPLVRYSIRTIASSKSMPVSWCS